MKDLVYRRVFFVAMGMGFFFIALSLLLGPLSYKEQVRIAVDFSLTGIQIALIFLSVLIGADFIRRDIEEHVVFSLLARPLSRFQYYISKFLSFALCALGLTFIMWLSFFFISLLVGINLDWHALLPFLGVYIEALVLFSLSLLLSLFSSLLVTIGASFSIFLVGHWMEVFQRLYEQSSSFFVSVLGWFLVKVLPNLEALNWKSHLTNNKWLELSLYLKFSVYGLVWAVFFLILGSLVFNKKDFS